MSATAPGGPRCPAGGRRLGARAAGAAPPAGDGDRQRHPDSFSDGGQHATTEAAIRHGLLLRSQGADVVDIGGESDPPGATRPVLAQEMGRVVPVISALAQEGVAVSVDTMRHEVADAALEAGAVLVNDVSGGLADPDVLRVVARARGGVRRHALARPLHPDAAARDVRRRAGRGPRRARPAPRGRRGRAGVDPDRLVADPGLGFAKTADHNWELLQRLPELESLGVPLLVGSSRKSFLGQLLAGADGAPRPVLDREAANVALTTIAAVQGVWAVRVHEVRGSLDAIRVVTRWLDLRPGATPEAR